MPDSAVCMIKLPEKSNCKCVKMHASLMIQEKEIDFRLKKE